MNTSRRNCVETDGEAGGPQETRGAAAQICRCQGRRHSRSRFQGRGAVRVLGARSAQMAVCRARDAAWARRIGPMRRGRRFRRARRRAGRRADGSRRHQPGRCAARAARRARRSSGSGPTSTCCAWRRWAKLAVADIGDVPMRSRFSLASCHADIEAFYARIAAAGVIPLSVGGDHSITLPDPAGRSARARRSAWCTSTRIAIPAGEYEGAKFHHGGPFRQAVLDGVLDPERTIQIGIRGGAEYLWEFSYDSGMTVMHAEDVLGDGRRCGGRQGARGCGRRARLCLASTSTASIPAFAPGTGTPEVGGLTPREALAHPARAEGDRHRRRRRGGGRAAVRRHHDDGADRRADAVRAAVPGGVAEGLEGIRRALAAVADPGSRVSRGN